MAIRFPFTPEVLDSLPEELAELFRGLELTLLREICSRLKLADQLNEVTVQDIRALRAHGIDLKDIEKAIRDVTGISQKKLDKLLDEVVERNQAYYTEMVTLADVTTPQTLVDEEDIDAIRKQCQREFGNITRSMGFVVRDGRHWTMLKPAKAYQHCLDSALLQVQSGAIDYNTAIRNAVRELADSGLKAVDYESGHVDQIDVAARRAVMTGVNQINAKYREQSMDYLETDLVEVSAHLGARNIPGPNGWEAHTEWQGKVFRWNRSGDGRVESESPAQGDKAIDVSAKSATIKENAADGGEVSVRTIGKIDIEKYKCVTPDITTDEVIITDERIAHIKERHPNDYERFVSYIPEIVADPDYILEANKEHTGVLLKEFEKNGEQFKLVLRLKIPSDPEEYKNSVLSFWHIGDTTWKKTIKNKNILYKKE